MARLARYLLQLIAYAALGLVTVWFSSRPVYMAANQDMAVVKLSLSHATALVEPCRQLTQEEIAEFAANMRRTEVCGRERVPIVVEMDVDGEAVVRTVAEPSGLWNDGPAAVYERVDVEPGSHRLSIRIRDTGRTEGWDLVAEEAVELVQGRYLTVTFRPSTGEFRFR